MIRDSECHILHSIFLKMFKWIWQRPTSGLARSNYFPSPKSRWWNNACTDNQLIPSHWSAWHLSARIICDVHQVLVFLKHHNIHCYTDKFLNQLTYRLPGQSDIKSWQAAFTACSTDVSGCIAFHSDPLLF